MCANPSNRTDKVLVIHGPNLNMLGQREPSIYGAATLSDIDSQLTQLAEAKGVVLSSFQSNWEGAIIDCIQAAANDVSYIIINPAALTHTSVGVRDALLAVNIPYIEVHLSNVHAREAFRHQSFLSDKALGVICGLGSDGYVFALHKILQLMGK